MRTLIIHDENYKVRSRVTKTGPRKAAKNTTRSEIKLARNNKNQVVFSIKCVTHILYHTHPAT